MIETAGVVVLWLIVGGLVIGGAILWLVDSEASRIGGEERSRFPKVMLAIGLVLGALMLAGCVTSPPVYGDVPECERLIPDSLKTEVPGVAIPDSEDAEPWMQAFVGQTGQLDKANERAPAVDHIYKTCLDLHRKALDRSKRGFFGRLFG